MRCVLVLAEPDAEARRRAIDALAEAGALQNTKILEAATPIEGHCGADGMLHCTAQDADDVLVVVDSLRPYLVLWQAVCKALSDANIAVGAEEEGSQQRSYYSRLVERAARRKERKEDEGSAAGGGSVTLLLLQPSVSVLPTAGERKEAYTLADFESGGFTKTVCSRVKMLEDKV